MAEIPLDALITEANILGWAVTLRQHPDRRAYWEASLSRPLAKPHPNGIVRELAFAIADTPIWALTLALCCDTPTRLEPAGISAATPDPTFNLLAALGISEPAALPKLTRRI